ncbi:nucleotide pyrophosphatase [Desulfolithobacter dissulfuricans]|uniref:Nucleotide pyrophosphatase n=1 Tax=Desulfolithobacter dissulfuricans TaxID=2795293 RepID=A0A915XIT3_9BACT|nr:alkaline phosphatase family protein [Desulfolithobacter dissulfuricans]BCO07932.1 nucleotide pyrophosphatase [Desulfolithobacter dissulfuricans]
MGTKTLLIGLDGATFTILDSLTAQHGEEEVTMPFLASLYRKGSRGILRSTPNPLTPPAWVSLMTGYSPGHHGIYDFIRSEEADNDIFFTLYDARDCRVETIWSLASRAGQRIVALNFPFTAPPPDDINGVMIPGFIPWRHLRNNTTPKDLYDRLRQDLPDFNPRELAWDFELEKKAVTELSATEREDWIRYHLPRERLWFSIAKYLMETEQPDLMAVMFDGVDKIQHQAWHFLDPTVQETDRDEYYHRMRSLCLEYFRNLDGYIQELVTAAGPDAQVFLVSDHGFTTTYEVVRINTYLHEKGYLKWKEMPDTEAAKRREESMFANLDWSGTTAYCSTPSSNGITIRVARNPGDPGVPEQEYERFREQLIEDLRELRDPATGERIITGIHKREEVFSGPAMADAPDLLLVLRDFGFVSIKNKKPVVQPREEVAGTHHPEGILIACGRGIRENETVAPCDIVDAGALLLYSLGLKVPRNMEGRVPENLFTDSQLQDHPVCLGDPTVLEKKETGADKMSEDEKERLLEQLKMLGYME